MEGTRGRGRPLTPLDPDASASARLGAELRARRLDKGLTLKALATLVSYSQQHISEVERAKSTPGHPFIAACDSALDANGTLLELLPAATDERLKRCEDRSAARRTADDPALRCLAHSDAGDDVEPTNRRGLLGAAGAAAIGLSTTAAPAAARKVDPELPAHLANLLRLLGRHDETFGPRDMFGTVQRELGRIAQCRDAATGELRTALMRVEARWCDLAAWLSEDTGDRRTCDAWRNRSLRLAQESDYPDMVAFARCRMSERASVQDAAALADAALSVSGASAQTRAWCARQAAISYAMSGDADTCERRLSDAYGLLDDAESPPPPWAGGYRVARTGTLAAEARCWAALDPARAVRLYDDALREWPRAEVRDGGLHRARLAMACAAAGELDRAEAEGRKALAVMHATTSTSIARELRQLGVALNAN